jgi:hypothetical protein
MELFIWGRGGEGGGGEESKRKVSKTIIWIQ